MKTLIYYDEEKRKAVFVCPVQGCHKGIITYVLGTERNQVTGIYEKIYKKYTCGDCNGTGVDILDVPEL